MKVGITMSRRKALRALRRDPDLAPIAADILEILDDLDLDADDANVEITIADDVGPALTSRLVEQLRDRLRQRQQRRQQHPQ
jgi:hypothetical protein